MFAGNFPGVTQTMPLAIYGRFGAGDMSTALLLSVVLLLASLIVLLGVRIVGGRVRDGIDPRSTDGPIRGLNGVCSCGSRRCPDIHWRRCPRRCIGRAIWRRRWVPLPTHLPQARRSHRAGFGGNKARKLEYLLADALAAGATMLVTEGAAQSNHARVTAAAAAIAGLAVRAGPRRTPRRGRCRQPAARSFTAAEVSIVPARRLERTNGSSGRRVARGGEAPLPDPDRWQRPHWGGRLRCGGRGAHDATVVVSRSAGKTLRGFRVTGRPRRDWSSELGAFSAPFAVCGVAVEHPVEKLIDDCVTLANQHGRVDRPSGDHLPQTTSQSMVGSSAQPTVRRRRRA